MQTLNESNLVALIAHESAIARQVDAAERRATVCCKEYNPDNIHWKHVDSLLEEQAELTRNIKTFTKTIKLVSYEKDTFDLTENNEDKSTKDNDDESKKGAKTIDVSTDDNNDSSNNVR